MRRIHARRTVTAAAVGLAATLALTACGPDGQNSSASKEGGDSSSAAASASSDTPSSADQADGSSGSSGGSGSSSGSSGGSAAASGSGSSGSSASAKGAACRTSNLRITAKNKGEDGPNGLGEVLITFTNTGSDCRMSGFPGVDLKTNYGSESVDRNKQERGMPFTLKAGKRATASVVYTVNKTGGSGVRVSAFVVTPPNETHHVTVPVSVSLPVSDKSDGRLDVTPVFEEH